MQESKDEELGFAKNVVKMIKADVIEHLDAPLEILGEFKTFLWEHEGAFDADAFKTNRLVSSMIPPRNDTENIMGLFLYTSSTSQCIELEGYSSSKALQICFNFLKLSSWTFSLNQSLEDM